MGGGASHSTRSHCIVPHTLQCALTRFWGVRNPHFFFSRFFVSPCASRPLFWTCRRRDAACTSTHMLLLGSQAKVHKLLPFPLASFNPSTSAPPTKKESKQTPQPTHLHTLKPQYSLFSFLLFYRFPIHFLPPTHPPSHKNLNPLVPLLLFSSPPPPPPPPPPPAPPNPPIKPARSGIPPPPPLLLLLHPSSPPSWIAPVVFV